MYRRAAPYMEQASSRYRSGSFCTDRYRGGCPWLFSEVADLTKAGSGLGRPNCHKCFDTNTVEYGPSSGIASTSSAQGTPRQKLRSSAQVRSTRSKPSQHSPLRSGSRVSAGFFYGNIVHGTDEPFHS